MKNYVLIPQNGITAPSYGPFLSFDSLLEFSAIKGLVASHRPCPLSGVELFEAKN